MQKPLTETDPVFSDEALDFEARKVICDAFNAAWLLLLTRDDPAANLKRYPTTRDILLRHLIGRVRFGNRDAEALKWEGFRYVSQTLTPDYPKG